MRDIRFYILSSRSEKDRYHFACKLIEKAYRSGHKVYVLTDTEKQSRQLDDLLWTFRAGSFIPHQIYSGIPPSEDIPVVIGSLDAPENWQKTIVNLSSRNPEEISRTERLLEILDDNENIKAVGRNRYRNYQLQGHAIHTHKIQTKNQSVLE